ncbi:MAG TPA: hypothetical protein VKU03_03660 [Roseiarcus sp.]|nr:hypothetical protein [Roseiarcus sp.]
MSLAAARPSALSARGEAGFSLLRSPAGLAVLALILSIVKFWPAIVSVWTTGAFANPDDAMRLVEVRDLIAGQNWFDLHQYRLDPPAGVDMHWTRVLDLPLALLIKSFSLALPVEAAERLTRIVFPLALLFALYGAIFSLARRLAGPAALLPAMIIAILAGAMLGQFEPGRIHHHIAQILLAVLILRATIEAVWAKSVGRAAFAAALAALSLSINIENITYILVEIAVFALVFVAEGEAFAAALAGFAVSLAVSSLLLFAATVGPSHYFLGACDAFSTPHLLAILIGAAALLAMAAGAGRLAGWPLRLAACALGGAAVVAALASAYPACLADPQAGVDPLLRLYWLSHVKEARPLLAMIRATPSDFFLFALAPILGLLAALAAAWRSGGASRAAWLIVAAFAAIGLATSSWQVRAISSTAALALFGGVWASAQVLEWAERKKNLLAKAAPIAAILPFCSIFWALLVAVFAPEPAYANAAAAACRSPATIHALDALPKSLIMAAIDMGSDILAETDHSVLAAPYHRNNRGNGEFVRAMIATPDAARKIAEDSGAAYLVFCPARAEFDDYVEGSPDGLAAVLRKGDAPDWLSPVAVPPGSPLQIYRIR